MTKRDTQAKEYAAESAGERTSPSVKLTDSELSAVQWFAHYGLPAHRANTLRKLLERLK
jgi:hypothetical protein